MKISNVEIVTVSERGARVNWRADRPADFVASCSSPVDNKKLSARVEVVNGRHYLAAFDGLVAGAAYKFQISAGGGTVYKGAFDTLKKPGGRFRFRFATINDIHVGEEIYGLIILPGLKWLPLTPGLKLDIDGVPFWQYTNEAVVRELNELELDFIIVKGDLVTDHTERNIRRSKEIMDSLEHPYYIIRGNHDRAGGMREDYFRNTFGVRDGWQSFEHKGCGFLLLDCIHPKSGYTTFPVAELEWFEKEMKRMAHMPVFVYLHNPPLRSIERSFVNRVGRFLGIIDAHPTVAGVFYAHTHANKRILRRGGGKTVPFVETAATMDYPGGYNIYDVYSGGYIQTCVRPHDKRCSRWFELCEKAYYGLAAARLFGKISDRNFTWSGPLT